ncbi:TPA: hypothetical protein ACQ30S_004130 [Yersinia enterocolitica]
MKTYAKPLGFVITSIILGFIAYLMRVSAQYIGFPDGGRTSYMRCAEPMFDINFIIPAAGSAALLIILFAFKPRWRLFFYAVGATALAMLIWAGAIEIMCGGLENGTGG